MTMNESKSQMVDPERFKQMLRLKGLKVTNQRIYVLQTLESCRNKHLTEEEIYNNVKVDHPEIGLATVYRTIQILKELHLIDRINFDDGTERYEIAEILEDGVKHHHHHHLICIKCGKVSEFADDMLEALESAIMLKTGFHVVDHEVKLYGYCKECGGKLIEETKK